MSRVEERISIERDGTIVARSGKVELGQGLRAAFARLVAAGLDVSPANVRVELGDTATAPWDMGTFGSLSVRSDGAALGRAARHARELLLRRAARRWGVDVTLLDTANGLVLGPQGQRATYAELVGDAPLSGVLPPSGALEVRDAGLSERTRAERWDMVTGAARFVADRRGMLHGKVLHPPRPGARLIALDETAARAVEGVVAVVCDGDFAGVVATTPSAARAGRAALVAEWGGGPVRPASDKRLVLRDDPRVLSLVAGTAIAIDHTYEQPHVAAASLGPNAAFAEVHAGGAEIHATTQRPFGLRDEAARLLGLDPTVVRVVGDRAAGTFGRGNSGDAALEAARLARAVGRPVFVQWSRAEELRLSPCRPMQSVRVRAGVGDDGRLTAWSSEIVTNPHVYFGDIAHLPDEILAMTCGRNAVPGYVLPAAHVAVHIVSAPVRTGALRSLAAAPNVFAIESAIDELAHRAGRDPLELRLDNIADPRLARVLTAVAERSEWSERPRGGGIARGIACAIYNDTYVAEVAEVEVIEAKVRVLRAWCALDCGTVVDPDGARNQIEGAIVHATSWALLEELLHDDGRVIGRSWEDYPIARFADAPAAIDVVFTDNGTRAPTGVGEPGAVPFGAAIANAVFAATGQRVRRLPIRL